MSKRKTTAEFIQEAKQVHGDKYDYSKVDYINSSSKVCIICPIHGEFVKTVNNWRDKDKLLAELGFDKKDFE